MNIGDLVRILPRNKQFDQFAAGSLGDGRYISLAPGVTGRVGEFAKPYQKDLFENDSILFIPSGFPENQFCVGFIMGKSMFEPWSGEEKRGDVFYQINGKKIPAE